MLRSISLAVAALSFAGLAVAHCSDEHRAAAKSFTMNDTQATVSKHAADPRQTTIARQRAQLACFGSNCAQPDDPTPHGKKAGEQRRVVACSGPNCLQPDAPVPERNSTMTVARSGPVC